MANECWRSVAEMDHILPSCTYMGPLNWKKAEQQIQPTVSSPVGLLQSASLEWGLYLWFFAVHQGMVLHGPFLHLRSRLS